MPLNIKNDRVERLIAEVARLTGESKTEAVRRALEERHDRLARQLPATSRADRLLRFLENEMWPAVPPDALGQRLSKEEEEQLLGYDEAGV